MQQRSVRPSDSKSSTALHSMPFSLLLHPSHRIPCHKIHSPVSHSAQIAGVWGNDERSGHGQTTMKPTLLLLQSRRARAHLDWGRD